MGNTSSERAAMGHGEKSQRRDSRGIKEGERPKILMDSPEDADIFHGEDIKVSTDYFVLHLTICYNLLLNFNEFKKNSVYVSGSFGKGGIPRLATRPGSRGQGPKSGSTHSLSLDWRWKGGLFVRILQQLGQQDSSN